MLKYGSERLSLDEQHVGTCLSHCAGRQIPEQSGSI